MRNTNWIRTILFLFVAVILAGCAGKHKNLSTSSDPALFVPILADEMVEMYVDELDGKAVKFAEFDSVSLDPGTHEIVVRLEYQPATGTSLVVGGFGNLFLRAATNKTFRTGLEFDLEPGGIYQLTAKINSDNGFDVIIFDNTNSKEIVKQSFRLKDGNFETIF